MNKYVTNLTLPNGTNVLIKDSECRTNLSNEIRRATAKETELEEADTHLRNDLTTETNTRKQRDTALQNNINAEVSAREQGDNKNNAEIAKIHSNITSIENKNTEQDNELTTLRTMISSPYNFKGEVASLSALPASGQVNDTYYVQDVKYKVTWTGSAWVQSSLNEADYQTELGDLKSDLINVDNGLISGYNVSGKLIDGYYFDPNNGYNVAYAGWSVTELIPIIDYQTICITIGRDTNYNGFFDDSKKFIKGFQLYVGNNITDVPPGAKYFCVSNPTEIMKQAKIWNEKSAVYLKDNKVSIDNIIGGVLDIPYDYLNGERQLQLKAGYDNLLAYYKKSPNAIPLFVSTDNHMNPNPQTPQKYINNIDKDGMEINNINLGDSFVDNYTDEQSEGLIKITQYIKNYIGVTGNHDIQNATDVSQYYLRRAFGTTNLHREVIKTNYRNCYVTFDELRRVKFIVIDPYELDSQTSVKYDVKIDTNTANWLLEELSNDSERDIVILMHQPLTSRNIHRDGTLQTWHESEEYLSKMGKVFNVLKDRKNKRSGIYVDDYGVSHNYNFSNTKSELLCIINGHAHEELYLIEDGLTTYVCDWEGFDGNKSNTYILIDRDLKKMIIYKVGPTSLYERLDLNI